MKKRNKKQPDDTYILYEAVQKYIENRGGKILVIGGVEIIEMPGEADFVYHFAVKIAGKKPVRPQ